MKKFFLSLPQLKYFSYIISVQDVWPHAAFRNTHIRRIKLKVRYINERKANSGFHWLSYQFVLLKFPSTKWCCRYESICFTLVSQCCILWLKHKGKAWLSWLEAKTPTDGSCWFEVICNICDIPLLKENFVNFHCWIPTHATVACM